MLISLASLHLFAKKSRSSSTHKKPYPKIQKRLAVDREEIRGSIEKAVKQVSKQPQKKQKSKTLRGTHPVTTPHEVSTQKWLRNLHTIIDKLVHEVDKKASVGVKVVLLKNNHIIYEKNAQQLFKPASTTKLITSAAAYHILGPDYRFTTKLYTDKKYSPHCINNLYIKGSGDPTLKVEDMNAMVNNLKRIGIREIRGNIIVDATYFDEQGTGPGWHIEDANHYQAPTSGLMVNHSCIRVHVKPSQIFGQHPFVFIDPQTSYIKMINRAQTHVKTDDKTLQIKRKENNIIIVAGPILRYSKLKQYSIAIEHPSIFAGHVFKQQLTKKIIFRGKVLTGTLSNEAHFLVKHSSQPLKTIIRQLMKTSDNLCADALFRAMGAQKYGVPGTWAKGQQAINDFLKNTVGISLESMVLYDGSGLSHKNQISPDHFCKLLTWVYATSPHKNSFITSLPIGGIDGSLRNRLKYWSTKGSVQAKTGTLNGVTALSGYIIPKRGLPFIFVIMVNCKEKSALNYKKSLEDELCKLLAFHATGTF